MEKVQELVTLELHIDYEMQKSTVAIQYDPVTGKSDIRTVCDPDPATMDAWELIRLMEAAAFHMQCLQEEEPQNAIGDQHLIWQGRFVQTEELLYEAREWLVDTIEGIRDRNCGHNCFRHNGCWLSFERKECHAFGLEKPEEFIYHWYAYGTFPRTMGYCDMESIRSKLDNLEYGWKEEPKDHGDAKAWALYWFRQELKSEQLRQIKKMMLDSLPQNMLQKDWEEIEERQYDLECAKRERGCWGDNYTHRAKFMVLEANRQLERHLLEVLREKRKQDSLPGEMENDLNSVSDESLWKWADEDGLETAEENLAFWYIKKRYPSGMDWDQIWKVRWKLEEHDEIFCNGPMEKGEQAEKLYEFRDEIRDKQKRQLKDIAEEAGLIHDDDDVRSWYRFYSD